MTKKKTEVVPYDLFDSWPTDRFFGLLGRGRWLALRFPRFPEIPEMTVSEKDDEVIVEAPVAGIPAENLEVTYDGRSLRIEGTVEKTSGGETISRRIGYEALLAINPEGAEATVENGMLTVRAPKGKRVEATKIAVKPAEKK